MPAFFDIPLNLRESWGVVGISLYMFCLGLPLNEIYSSCLICLLAGALVFLRRDVHSKVNKPITSMLVIFVFTTLLSTLMSVDPFRSAIISLSLFPAAVVFYIISDRFNLRHLNSLFYVLSLTAIVISCTLLVNAWISSSDDPTRWMADASFTYLSTPNDLILVALTVPLTIAIAYVSDSLITSIVAFLSFLFGLLVIVVFRSNAALLVLVIELLVMGLFFWRKYLIVGLLVFIVTVVVADGLQGFSLIAKIVNPVVWGNRLPLWMAAVHMFLDAPYLGHGPGSFSVLSENYIQGLELPDWVVQDPRHAPWAHNLYLELLAERGVFGLLSFLVLIGLITKNLVVKIYRKPDVTVVSLLACLIGVLLVGVFELSILRHWVLILLAAICAITVVIVKQDKFSRGKNQ